MIAFEVLCKKKLAKTLLGIIERFTNEDAKFIDSSTNWTSATKWVEWWMRPQHLKLLHKDYAEMDESIWNRCPSDTNAVERKNLDSKESLPQQLQIAMTNLYKYDKAACAKNIAAKQGVSVTYCDQSQEARKSEAAKRRQITSGSDLTSQYGPHSMDLLIVSVILKTVERKEKVQEVRVEMQSDLRLSQLFLRQLMKIRTSVILHSLVFNSQKVQEEWKRKAT